MKKWKLWLKGIFDQGHLKKQIIIVTGSAQMDQLKNVGDSLAGRYFQYHLHPLDLKELKKAAPKKLNALTTYERLCKYSGFPEPFIESDPVFYKQWSKTHADQIIKNDLLNLEVVRDIDSIMTLIHLLQSRVGSNISYNSLAEDLDKDDKTIKKWIILLENLYVGFRLLPYSKNIARAKKKAFKFYFYDQARVLGDEGAKLENLVAISLKKEIDFIFDTQGIESKIHFLQIDKNLEIDFVVFFEDKRIKLFEVKLSDQIPSKSFRILGKYFKNTDKIQLVKNIDKIFHTKEEIQVLNALEYLSDLNLGE
jgi:predicted AAA+ superfamily ATPase